MENNDSPESGHTFRFRFDIRGSSRVTGETEHRDAPDFMGPVHEFQVRAWSLSAALRRAANLPFGTLMGRPVIDYRDLLKKYINHVGEEEGAVYLNYRPEDRFTEEEWAELQAIDAEHWRERRG